ncbi:hypothetical protein [Burkholderia cenocepacia]|uniref:hypothetical protein n=1 Tax=Burkholderia cenocepacia TaxID=95486 RepID=UPI002B243681|nr:hypothetical protein [Burkholderia cenocepacia]MEB2499218.1 hypothetical protein [Burkholderia cenocepacia]MEB2556778.1 hypothetical protein [Burkholderia cenocepacia]
MCDRYAGIERDLVHVKNALQTLSKSRDEFPLGTSIRDPAYWQARLESIRAVADRYNYRDLRDRSDELLIEISKLRYWTARPSDTDGGWVSASRSARPQKVVSDENKRDTRRPLVARCNSILPTK